MNAVPALFVLWRREGGKGGGAAGFVTSVHICCVVYVVFRRGGLQHDEAFGMLHFWVVLDKKNILSR